MIQLANTRLIFENNAIEQRIYYTRSQSIHTTHTTPSKNIMPTWYKVARSSQHSRNEVWAEFIWRKGRHVWHSSYSQCKVCFCLAFSLRFGARVFTGRVLQDLKDGSDRPVGLKSLLKDRVFFVYLVNRLARYGVYSRCQIFTSAQIAVSSSYGWFEIVSAKSKRAAARLWMSPYKWIRLGHQTTREAFVGQTLRAPFGQHILNRAKINSAWKMAVDKSRIHPQPDCKNIQRKVRF